MNRFRKDILPPFSQSVVLLFLLFLSMGIAVAQDGETPPTPQATEVNLLEILQSGGVIMIFLAVLSVIALALIVLYYLTIRKGTVASNHFMQTADDLIRRQDYIGLLAVCRKRNESIARVTHKTLDFATKNPTATWNATACAPG